MWTTDKDGIILDLLAAEMMAKTGRDPSQLYLDLTKELGVPVYQRIDAPATPAQKAILKKLSPQQIQATELAGEKITGILTSAPGTGSAIGGLKVMTENGWFAARPSGTEDVYKIYAESFRGDTHLKQIQEEAQALEEGFAGGGGEGVDLGGGGLLEGVRPVERVLGEDCSAAEGLGAVAAVHGGGFFFYLLYQVADPLLVVLGSQVSPAGKGSEGHEDVFFEVDGADLFAACLAAAGVVESGAVDPDARDTLARHQGFGAMDAGPVAGAGDEALLASLGKQVLETSDLAGLLVGHGNTAVAAFPETPFPTVKPAGFLGDVAGDEVHEGREVLLARSGGHQVIVVAGHGEADQLDGVLLEAFGDDASDQEVEPLPRLQEVVAQETALGDVGKELAGRKVPWLGAHTHLDAK